MDGNTGDTYRLYGQRGWGSAITETLLALCGARCAFEDVAGFDRPGPARERLLAVNPLAQVPTLVLPGGTVMTEGAAIALWLAEAFPAAGLAPPPGHPARAGFLRRLVWLVASLYPTFTFADYPERFAVPLDAAPAFRAAVGTYRESLWRQFEADLGGAGDDWCLADAGPDPTRPTALDVYVGVMTRFTPRRAWFAAHGPRLAAIAGRLDAHPVAGPVLALNFPSTGA